MKKQRLRPLGHVTDDLEPLLQEMALDHEMQMHEILNIIRGYLEAHLVNSVETYEDGTRPVFFYGHIDNLKKE